MIPTGLEVEEQPVPKGLEVEQAPVPRGLEIDSSVPSGLEVVPTGLENLTPRVPSQNEQVSDFASRIKPPNAVSYADIKIVKPGFDKESKLTPTQQGALQASKKYAGGGGPEGAITKAEAEHIVDKERLLAYGTEGKYFFLLPAKSDGIIDNVLGGVRQGIANLDSETILGRLFADPATIEEHKKRYYGHAGEKTPAIPGETWYDRVAFGLGQSLPAMLAGGAAGKLAGALGSSAVTTAAVGAAPFALDTAVTTIPEALAANGDRGKAVLEGASNAAVTMAAFTFLGPLGKLFGSKQVAEQLVKQSVIRSAVKGGLGLGAAGMTDQVGHELNKEIFRSEDGLTSEEFADVLTNPDKWKDRAISALPMIIMGMGGGALETLSHNKAMKDGKFIGSYVKNGLVTLEEAVALKQQPELYLPLAKARYDGNLAEVKATTGTDGKQTLSLDIKPDVITYDHRKALNFNEPAIALVRENILSGKNKVEDIFPAKGNGKIKLAIDSTNLQRPETLTQDLRLRSQLANTQRRYTDEVLSLSSDQNKLPIDQRIVLRDVITAEFNAKMERLTKQVDDSPVGAKEQVTRRIKNKVDKKLLKPTEAASLNEQISKALDNVVAGNTNITQRETVARLIEHFSDQGEAGASPVKFLEELYGKMANDPNFQPYSERVKAGLAATQKFIQDSIVSRLEFNSATKLKLQELTSTLPPEKAKPWLDQIIKAETKESFAKIAIGVFKAQETYARQSTVAKIEKSLGKLKGGPREQSGHELLGKLDSSILVKEPITGKTTLNKEALTAKYADMDIKDLTNLANELSKVVRQSQIEKGLYNKWTKFSTAADREANMTALGKDKLRAEYKQKLDKAIHLGKYVTAPISNELWLQQRSGHDAADPMRKLLHEDMIPSMSQHFQNMADTRRFVAEKAKQYFGIDSETVRGQQKLAKVLAQKTKSGLSLDRVLQLEALHTDQGRTEALAQAGAEYKGKRYTAKDVLGSLTDKQRAFVDDIKGYLADNPMVEKALKQFTLFNGYDIQRRLKYFASRRVQGEEPIHKNVSEFSTSLEKDINQLKETSAEANQPFDLSGGFLNTFLRVSDKLSLYGEMYPHLYRAEKLLGDKKFGEAFVERHGESRLNALKQYINNIYGRLGTGESAIDAGVSYVNTAWTISKISWNVASAAKQYLHLLTIFGDGTIDRPAITRALAEQAQFNKGVKERMKAGSGLAYRMTTGGGFLESQLIFGESGAPSKLKLMQHYGTVLQREANEQIMAVAWRAAEISAKAKGMTGTQAADYTQKVFELAMGRDQPTNHPLYASPLELDAKTRPLLRGQLAFMREQNRILTSTARRVGMAIKNPTAENMKNAGYMLLFGAVGTSIGAASIDSLRKLAFGKDVTGEEFAGASIKNLAGLWYAGSTAIDLVEKFFDPMSRDSTKGGPAFSMMEDVIKMAVHTVKAADAGSDEDYKSGPKRGYGKADEETIKAVDNGLSLVSGIVGLPFWSVWYQAKGLYNWQKQDLIMMTELEQERAKLNKNPNANARRLLEIKTGMDAINKIHREREAGLLTKDRARERTMRELERIK